MITVQMLYNIFNKNKIEQTPQMVEVFNSGVSSRVNIRLNNKLYNNKEFIPGANKTSKAFTLIELLVVIAIIGILSTLVIVSLGNSRAKARDSKRLNDLKAMANALELYYANNNQYPSSITPGESLEAGGIVYMGKVPNNPTPRTDGGCPDSDYTYSQINGGKSYSIIGCIGANQSNLVAGGVSVTNNSGLQSIGSVNGLLLYFDASNPVSYPGSGTTWYDLSGSGYNGTLVNGVGYNNQNGGSLIFDGLDDYIDLGSDVVFKDTCGWTVETWVKYSYVAGAYDGTTSPANFIGANTVAYNSWYWSVFGNRLALWNISPGIWRYGSTTLVPGVWYNAVLVCYNSGNSYQMYLNGVPEGGEHTTYNWNPIYSGLRIRYIGRGNFSPSSIRLLNGLISVKKIYNRTLSAEEILQNYNATKGRFGL